MRLAVLVLACISCGRVGFDSPRTDRIDASIARPDAVVNDSVCPLAQVGATVTYAGQTFQYTGFNNQTGPVSDVLVSARDGGAVIAQTTSDASGNYALTIPTNNTARRVEIDYETSGYWETRVLSDRPLDADVVSPNIDRYRLGDGPLWGDGQMGSVYSANPNPYDLAKGTLNIAVRDCDDNIVEGAVVSVTPAPETLQYIDSGGLPTTQISATVAPYTTAIAFNAIPGPTHITVTKDGVTIYSFDVDTRAGRYVEIPVVHIPQ